ncbi:hypothetical protein H114_03421 [Streptomyces gancidicus BKS 13-15]|uniref:Uncharacterized protein n=1 Tax=Streptomyces gancidicus BKS 13-15 TaxID=1284664 RepID=M3D272_STREZ|nr:hypothetical protein H114_03421 [Streptomyces gancidicus BKS 13-15]
MQAPKPALVSTPAEYIAALRALRFWSGLTYRQLEAKATAHNYTLPASTIATTLGRTTLPRERFVDAFTRACGLTEEDVEQWLEARRHIAIGERAPAAGKPAATGDDGDGPAPGASAPSRLPRWRRALGLALAATIGAAGTLVVGSLLDTSRSPAAPPAMPVTGLRMLAVGSWALIHPARTPSMCLTEGRDRTGRYETAVAAQRLCNEAVLPHVFLEPIGADIVQIQWHHPKYSIGCLTVLLKGAGRDLLEPRDDCADDNRAQQFRIEPFGPQATPHFRIRPVITGQCLSLRDQDVEAGAEVVQGRCSGAADQSFLIELIQPPQAPGKAVIQRSP